MSTFRLHVNGIIYLYHWITPKRPFKVSTGLKIDKSNWNAKKMNPRSPNFKFNGKNVTRELIKHKEALHEALNYFDINSGFSSMKLKERYKSNLTNDNAKQFRDQNTSFLNYFSVKVEEFKANNKSNWKIYNTTLIHLKEYFGRERPEFEDIDTSFYMSYNKILLEKELSTNTISNHWKYIKVIMKQAQYEKLHSNFDYQFFRWKRENADTVYLTEDELQKIFELDLNGYLDKYRDYFLIGCYTGLRYADWDQVKKSIIKDGQVIIRNSKTGERSVIPIAPNVIRILSKYIDGVLPHKPTNQKMNKYVKDIVKEAEIDDLIEIGITKGGKRVVDTKPKHQLVSTHTARRSFATIMVLNGVQPHLIMKITGHKSLSSFEKYIRFDELQASIQLKESASFKKSFGKALTFSEKLKSDPEFKKEKSKLLL